MALTANPRQVARELSDPRLPGAQCSGPLKTRRHHYVYRLVSGGAEPRVVFACAHCEHRLSDPHVEVELTEADVRRMEAQSMAAHRNACASIRPELRPPSGGPGRRAPARRLAGRR